MKKLYSLAALSALLYAMPAHANIPLGGLFHYEITPLLALPIALFFVVQALLLRYGNHDISYQDCLLMACVGNIPSIAIGYFPFTQELIAGLGLIYLIPIIDIALTSATISFIFGYPMKKIVPAIIAGTFAFYVIAIIWIFLNAPGFTGCCGH